MHTGVKQAWDLTKLSVAHWHGPLPKLGDGLETSTGRRYQIFAIHMKRDGSALASLECIVLPKGEPVNGTIYQWEWSPRRRRTRQRSA